MFQRANEGTIVTVWVVPGAMRDRIVGTYGDAVKVRVAGVAEAGKANTAMLRLLSDQTGVRCLLLRGQTSRRKAVLVEGREPSEVATALGIEMVGEET
jgi:uncharacterized protein (TIGR00251 family)